MGYSATGAACQCALGGRQQDRRAQSQEGVVQARPGCGAVHAGPNVLACLQGHPQPHGVCTQQVWMREAVHSSRSHSHNRPGLWSVPAAVACACAAVFVWGAGDWSSRFDAESVVSSRHACSYSPHTPMAWTSRRCQATRAGLRLWWAPSRCWLWRAWRVWHATTRWYALWPRHGPAPAGRLPAAAHAAGRPGAPTRRLQSVPSAAAVGGGCGAAGLRDGSW